MAQIRVNDVFNELIEENFEINECLNVLIKFKAFVDLVFTEIKNNMKSNHLQMYYDLNKEVLDVFKSNKKEFSFVDQNLSERKRQLFEILSSKTQNCDNSLQKSSETNNHSIDSTNINDIKVETIPPKNKIKTLLQRHKQNSNKSKDITNDKINSFDSDFRKKLKSIKTQNYGNEEKVPFLCDVEGCHYSTTVKKRMVWHTNSHKGIKPYNCSVCDHKFTSYISLWQHKNRLHNNQNFERNFKCQFEGCGKTFLRKDHLRSHSIVHTDIKHSCEWPGCDRTFRTKLALKTHISRDHLEVRPFICEVETCKKAYTRLDEFKVHVMSHNSERNFKCQFEGCGKAFKSKNVLRSHSYLHFGKDFRCDWPGCDFSVKQRCRLLKHRLIHTSERPFLCDWPECGKRFKDNQYLQIHQRIHSSDKRYACSWPGCQYRCTDSGNLVKHRRVHNKS